MLLLVADERAPRSKSPSAPIVGVNPNLAISARSSRLPVDPVILDIRIHRGAYRRIEGTEAIEELEALELVLHRIFHLGETQFDVVFTQ